VPVSIFFVGAIILVGLSKIKFGFDRDDCVDFTSCGGGSPDRTVFSFRGTSEIAMAYDFVAGVFI
jgi:hypothetical protein